MLVKNYQRVEETFVDELNAQGLVYEHEKSGARVCFVKNEDENKVFSISFKTPPADHSGLPHILEHSVLCGSKKFPIKDPFIELAKGSLNTFINAMTFSDKTMYPVASCNDKDFRNLTDVYLDAVLYPNIHENEKILKQEGWHYELESLEGDLIYNGVVYNEMKGAFSSPEQVIFRKIQQELYPDTPYAFESGGDPAYIPDLTQEAFLTFHKTYYHPSNSYIYFYGNVDVEEQLTWLDETYLSAFDRIDLALEIPKQKPFDAMKEVEEFYPIASNESLEGKTYLSYNVVLSEMTKPCEIMGMEILEYLLLEAPGAPLKEALIKAELGEDVFGAYDNGILQPSFSIVVKNSDEDKKEKFLKVIDETLMALKEHGIPRRKVEAAINYFEFKTREADFGRYPKGVIYAMRTMDSWLHGETPFRYLRYNRDFKALRDGLDKGCFDDLIGKYLLNNTHSAVIILKPDNQLVDKREKAIADKLRAYKNILSTEACQQIIDETIALKAYQEAGNSKEALATIPRLGLEDLDKQGVHIPSHISFDKSITLMTYPQFTNNIVYTKVLFNVHHIEEEDLPYLSLLEKIIGKMDTKQYGYSQLSDEINIHTGGIKSTVAVYGVNNNSKRFKPQLEVMVKCMENKIDDAYRLLEEVVKKTIFTNKERLKELIVENKSRMQMSLNGSGHVAAMTRAESYYAQSAKFRDYMNGIGFYEALKEWTTDIDGQIDDIAERVKSVYKNAVSKGNLIVSVSAYGEALEEAVSKITGLVESYSVNEESIEPKKYSLSPKNEGFKTASEVQFVAQVGNFIDAGFTYTGSMRVLNSIINHEYLWTQVRIKGGAYGAFAGFKRSGGFYLGSYRDPKIAETLNVYENLSEYVKQLDVDQEAIIASIIGTIGDIDQPLTPYSKMNQGISMYLSSISEELLQKERDEILETKLEDLRALGDLIDKTLSERMFCVIGNEHKIEENKEIFEQIDYLMN
jgi:presequence protease